MITPAFEITQDHLFLYIVIKAPYSKVSEADIYIENEEFKFYAKPYFLRLQLPASLVEDDRSNCEYSVENGEYKIKVAKEVPGTHFEDLEMLTKLLAPKGVRKVRAPLIEVIGSDNESCESEDEDFDWHFPQSLETNQSQQCVSGSKYGFGNQKSDIFSKLQEDLCGVLQNKNIEQSLLENRSQERLEFENENFDCDHYLADLFEDDEIKPLIKLSPPWKSENLDQEFTDKEKFILKNLPNKDYLFDKGQSQSVYLGLVDILFSYAYNWRCTEGEYSVESPWNIRTISPTLSWCDSSSVLRETLIACYRRTLIFPLYRNWRLARVCHKDVMVILSKGKKYVLKCLLDIYDLFSNSDPHYLLNDLYIRDYCIWLQKCSHSMLESLSESLRETKILKQDVGLDLIELEEAADLVLQEEETGCVEDLPENNDVAKDILFGIEELKI